MMISFGRAVSWSRRKGRRASAVSGYARAGARLPSNWRGPRFRDPCECRGACGGRGENLTPVHHRIASISQENEISPQMRAFAHMRCAQAYE
jgi:hypothetical protein